MGRNGDAGLIDHSAHSFLWAAEWSIQGSMQAVVIASAGLLLAAAFPLAHDGLH
jgi:hypothetical protein